MVAVTEIEKRGSMNKEDVHQLELDSSSADRRGWAWVAAGGGAVTLLVLGFDLLWVEAPNQPVLVRWLRLAAEHPCRIWLAASAFWAAVWPSNLPLFPDAEQQPKTEPNSLPES